MPTHLLGQPRCRRGKRARPSRAQFRASPLWSHSLPARRLTWSPQQLRKQVEDAGAGDSRWARRTPRRPRVRGISSRQPMRRSSRKPPSGRSLEGLPSSAAGRGFSAPTGHRPNHRGPAMLGWALSCTRRRASGCLGRATRTSAPFAADRTRSPARAVVGRRGGGPAEANKRSRRYCSMRLSDGTRQGIELHPKRSPYSRCQACGHVHRTIRWHELDGHCPNQACSAGDSHWTDTTQAKFLAYRAAHSSSDEKNTNPLLIRFRDVMN